MINITAEQAVQWAMMVSGLGALIGVGKWIHGWVKDWRVQHREKAEAHQELLREFNERRQTIADLVTDLKALRLEMKPNSGTTIRDQLNRIEVRQTMNEQVQDALIGDMQIGVIRVDKNGECTSVNRKMTQITGRSEDELKGFGWLNTVNRSERPAMRKEWDESLREEREVEMEFRVTSYSKDVRILFRNRKLRKNGELLGFLNFFIPYEEVAVPSGLIAEDHKNLEDS